MKNLIFCCNVWKEELMLPGCLQSIRRYHPEAKIVAVDGAYQSLVNEVKKEIALCLERQHYEVAKNYENYLSIESDDRTLEILRDFEVDQIIRCKRDEVGNAIPWEHEYVKRSQYFVGSEGDYYVVIDADERLVGALETPTMDQDAYNILIKREDNTPAYKILRIFKHFNGMRYYGAHHALFVGDRLFRKEDFTTVKNCILEHAQTYRVTKEPIRNMVKGIYYQILASKEEGAFRAQYQL